MNETVEKQQAQGSEIVALVSDLRKEIKRLNGVIDELKATINAVHHDTVKVPNILTDRYLGRE